MPTIGNYPLEVRQNSASPTDRIEWDGEGLYGGEVAAIIIGATIVASIIAVAVLWFVKRRTRRAFRLREKEKELALENGDNGVVEETPGGPEVAQTTPARDASANHNNNNINNNSTTYTEGASNTSATRDHAQGPDGATVGATPGIATDGSGRL